MKNTQLLETVLRFAISNKETSQGNSEDLNTLGLDLFDDAILPLFDLVIEDCDNMTAGEIAGTTVNGRESLSYALAFKYYFENTNMLLGSWEEVQDLIAKINDWNEPEVLDADGIPQKHTIEFEIYTELERLFK